MKCPICIKDKQAEGNCELCSAIDKCLNIYDDCCNSNKRKSRNRKCIKEICSKQETCLCFENFLYDKNDIDALLEDLIVKP